VVPAQVPFDTGSRECARGEWNRKRTGEVFVGRQRSTVIRLMLAHSVRGAVTCARARQRTRPVYHADDAVDRRSATLGVRRAHAAVLLIGSVSSWFVWQRTRVRCVGSASVRCAYHNQFNKLITRGERIQSLPIDVRRPRSRPRVRSARSTPSENHACRRVVRTRVV